MVILRQDKIMPLYNFVTKSSEKKKNKQNKKNKSLICISDCIPKNVPEDLNTSIHVAGDFFFFRERGWWGRDFSLRAEACRGYLA